LILNARVVGDVFDWLFFPIEDEIPLIPNVATSDDAWSIVSSSRFFGFLTLVDVDVRVFSGLNPIERRMDFAAAPSMRSLVPHELPLGPNMCTEVVVYAILGCLYPVEDVLLPMGDLAPLAVLEAPEDVVELLDATVDRLIALIIVQDIVPGLPLRADFETVTDHAFDRLFNVDDALGAVAARPVDLLTQLRPTDIPPHITAADLVEFVLETQVLPTVVFDAVDIEDLLMYEGHPPLAGDELDDPGVAALLSQYTRRRPHPR
jgi:hypothetical protein